MSCLGGQISLVASRNNNRPTVLGAKVGQVGKRLDKIAMVETVASVASEGNVRTSVKTERVGVRIFGFPVR